ncbi:hypothetical protein [Acidovorax cavernicola]|uniref:hypothetical protein n=1 Tax=Acidovorax cavernicola TaxID=1675792 RepID=UPI00142E0E88|nr:hypothetical protein [Acidovorax cavernicola]
MKVLAVFGAAIMIWASLMWAVGVAMAMLEGRFGVAAALMAGPLVAKLAWTAWKALK